MLETFEDKAKKLEIEYTTKYQKISNEELHENLQTWMNHENKKRGYLPGLSPAINITQLTSIAKECSQCISPTGHCSITNILRNMATMESFRGLLKDNLEEEHARKIWKIVNRGYGPYLMLKEFTKRICKCYSPGVEQKKRNPIITL